MAGVRLESEGFGEVRGLQNWSLCQEGFELVEGLLAYRIPEVPRHPTGEVG